MSKLSKVKRYILENNMLEKKDSVIVGISGGADSVCLLDMLVNLKEEFRLNIIAVHIHHGIRGAEADRDLEFVKKICKERKVELTVFYYDVPKYAKGHKISEEEAGRELRYKSFYEVSDSAKIAIAHNMNDNVETVIHNMCRGSGIAGLIGIKNINDRIIRPILCLTRQEIEEYLKINEIEYIVDSSNLNDEYTRNKIRINVMPYLTDNINNKACEHINELSNDVEEAEKYILSICKNLYKDIFLKKNRDLYVNIGDLKQEKTFIRKRLIRMAIEETSGKLKDISRKHIEDVLKLMDKQSGKYLMLPHNIIVRVQHSFLVFSIREESEIEKDEIVEINNPGIYEFGKYIFEVEILELEKNKEIIKNIENLVKSDRKLYTKWIDYDRINFTVCLRNRNQGDYLVINDRGGKKKLKQFFVDEKIPANERGSIPLLADGNHVIWVIGHRISEYYKVTKNSKRIMKITRREKNNVE